MQIVTVAAYRMTEKAAEFLAKAKEADEQASAAKDSVTQAAWQLIAANYRDLAQQLSG